MKVQKTIRSLFRIYFVKKSVMIETEGESSDLDRNLKIEYGIRSYVVSDGVVVSRITKKRIRY